MTRIGKAGSLKLDWNTSRFSLLSNTGSSLVLHHHLEVNTAVYEGVTYKLNEVRYHRRSEHVFTGIDPSSGFQYYHQFALEAEFRYSSADGRLLVISTLYKVGRESEYLKSSLYWDELPSLVQGTKRFMPNLLSPGTEILDPTYYIMYKGSLTTPPCTEGVTRIVMRVHPTLSLDQLVLFPHQQNFRPPQPLNGRVPIMFCDGDC